MILPQNLVRTSPYVCICSATPEEYICFKKTVILNVVFSMPVLGLTSFTPACIKTLNFEDPFSEWISSGAGPLVCIISKTVARNLENHFPLGDVQKGYLIFGAIFWPTYQPISDFLLILDTFLDK